MNEIDKYDFCTVERPKISSLEGTITFNYPKTSTFNVADYDWYIYVAIEKANEVKENRHLLTGELIISYRNAIREGFNHSIDSALLRKWDFPRNKNTIEGIKGYINRIQNAIDNQLKHWE